MRLAELRNNKKISQKELATQIGYSQNMISQWENGTRDPGTEVLKKLAAFFDVSVDYLLGEDNPPENKKILEEEEVTLNGRMVSEEEKEQMLRVLEALYRDAKEKNKRK